MSVDRHPTMFNLIIALLHGVISLFKRCPEAQVLFGFPLDIYPDASLLLDSHRFQMHATFLIEMIDMTVGILGEDNEKLKQTTSDIGKKHASMSSN